MGDSRPWIPGPRARVKSQGKRKKAKKVKGKWQLYMELNEIKNSLGGYLKRIAFEFYDTIWVEWIRA